MDQAPTSLRPPARAWWSITALLTLCGTAAGFVLLGVGVALLVTALGAGLTALFSWPLWQSAPDRPVRITALSLLGGLWLLALMGITGEFGGLGFALCALVAASGLFVFRRSRKGGRPPGGATRPTVAVRVPQAEGIPADPLPPPSSLPSLSTPDLCRVWRVSYLRAVQTDCPSNLANVATLRRACLDELERRDPAAFGRWLPTARAPGDPARFFCRQSQG